MSEEFFIDHGEMNEPEIHFIAPGVATHRQPCAVFHHREKAVFNCNEGVFEPSWVAQSEGWMLVCVAPGWRRWLVKKLGGLE